MITLRVAKIEDLIELAGNAMDPGLDTRPEVIRKWATMNMDSGPAYTALSEGRAIASFGVRLTRPGVGLVWLVVSKNIDRTFAFLREGLFEARTMIEVMAEKFELKKIRAVSRIGFGGSQRMLGRLGFERLRRHLKSCYVYRRRFLC